MQYSEHIVYVDESGDHGLASINPDYPVFVLAFCIFRKEEYAEKVVPAIMALKFDTFGHDMVILHEHDIRKKRGPFKMMSKEPREQFLERLTGIIDAAAFTLIAVVIDKQRLLDRFMNPDNPYHEAMKLGLERVFLFLNARGEGNTLTHVVFEARGQREDGELELAFRRVRDGANSCGHPLPLDIVFAEKRANSPGLQFADMVARPVGLSVLRQGQSNRAMDVLRKKLNVGPTGQVEGHGLKVFP